VTPSTSDLKLLAAPKPKHFLKLAVSLVKNSIEPGKLMRSPHSACTLAASPSAAAA
jgi:hypothetical protein